MCHSPLTAFWADCPGSTDPLEWTGGAGTLSSMDCETREDEHKTFNQIKACYPPFQSDLCSAVYKSSFHTKQFLISYRACTWFPVSVFSPDLYNSHRFLKRELCQGQNNCVFLAVDNLLLIPFLRCKNYNDRCHIVWQLQYLLFLMWWSHVLVLNFRWWRS